MLPRMARLSLTQRSQVVFAIASAAAMAAVLAGPWMQAERRAMDSQRAVWREAAIGWGRQPDAGDGSVRLISGNGEEAAGGDPFVLAALEQFQRMPEQFDFDRLTTDSPARLLYARALRGDELNRARSGLRVSLGTPEGDWKSQPLEGVVVMERAGGELARQIALDRVSLALSGGAAWVALLVVVRTLVMRGYLRAVRRLRDVADKVRAGDTLARSTLRTGDELQELGEAFNAMVEALEPVAISGQTLRLRVASEAGMSGAFAARRIEPLQELVRKALGPTWKVAVDAPREAPVVGAAPAHGMEQGIAENPLVREAMDAFDAIIMKVERRAPSRVPESSPEAPDAEGAA
jgi:HAMP domain-containing protein